MEEHVKTSDNLDEKKKNPRILHFLQSEIFG
jgi:hypothetical protein